MAQSDAKEKLLDVLDREAFRPVLDASPDDYGSDAERSKLRDVQDATRRERQRFFQSYGSAEEVRDNFRDDLDSDEAKEVHRQLRDLGLPTLHDAQPDFERVCREAGLAA